MPYDALRSSRLGDALFRPEGSTLEEQNREITSLPALNPRCHRHRAPEETLISFDYDGQDDPLEF